MQKILFYLTPFFLFLWVQPTPLGADTSSGFRSILDAFDIQWRIPLDQFRRLEIRIEEEWPVGDEAIAIRTDTRKHLPSNTGSLILVFHDRFGLLKTHWASLPFQRDPSGYKGMSAFMSMKEKLLTTYGQPSKVKEGANVRIHGFHGDFYDCLQDATCGRWEVSWKSGEAEAVILELIPLDSETGFLHITQQDPYLQQILEQSHQNVADQKPEI